MCKHKSHTHTSYTHMGLGQGGVVSFSWKSWDVGTTVITGISGISAISNPMAIGRSIYYIYIHNMYIYIYTP